MNGADVASLSLVRGLLLSWSRDRARAALGVPAAAAALLATSKPWFAAEPAHCAQQPARPGISRQGCRTRCDLSSLPAFLP